MALINFELCMAPPYFDGMSSFMSDPISVRGSEVGYVDVAGFCGAV